MDRVLLVLWYGNIAGELLLLFRLLFSGLVKPYPWFTFYVAFSLASDVLSLVASSSRIISTAVWPIYSITAPIILGLQVFVALEVYGAISEGYPAIGSFGTWVLAIAAAVGLVVSGVLSFIDVGPHSPWLFVAKRIVAAILMIFLLSVSWVFVYVTSSLRENVVIHCRLFTLYLAGIAVGIFGANIGVPRSIASMLMLTCCLACFLLWTILLSREGQKEPIGIDMTEEEHEENLRRKQALLDVGKWLKPF